MRDFLKMGLVLFLACGLAAGSLAVVNAVTKKPIADHAKEQRNAALREVAPGAEDFQEVTPNALWEARRQGQKAGYVFLNVVQGYSGPITLMFGTDLHGAITGLRVLSHSETPGLGAKITTPEFRNQFKARRAEELVLKKEDPAKGRIDAITGATISTRAVTGIVRKTLASFAAEKTGGDQ